MGLSGHRFSSGLTIAPRTRWQLRLLRRAVRAGDWLDAVIAAARIYNSAVRPSMDHGHWHRAQVTCERVLRRIPARGSPGYRRLRRVTEYFLASAAAAARADGAEDVQRPDDQAECTVPATAELEWSHTPPSINL
jgi:hypothetical protein